MINEKKVIVLKKKAQLIMAHSDHKLSLELFIIIGSLSLDFLPIDYQGLMGKQKDPLIASTFAFNML